MTEHLEPKFYSEMGKLIRKQILANGYTADSCIATTAATTTALRMLDVDAYPLSVQVMVINDVLFQWALEHDGQFPEAGSPEYPPGGYGLGVTRHVVTIAERRWMLDYSIDQANREDKGIILEPLVMPVEEAWLRGRQGHYVFRHRGTVLYYTARPGDKWWKDSPNWKGESRPGVSIRETKSADRRVANKRRLIR